MLPFKSLLTEKMDSFQMHVFESGRFILDLPAIQVKFVVRTFGDCTYEVLWVVRDSFYPLDISFSATKAFFRKTYP